MNLRLTFFSTNKSDIRDSDAQKVLFVAVFCYPYKIYILHFSGILIKIKQKFI